MDMKLQHYHKYEGRQVVEVVALCATCHCFPRYVLTDEVRLWCPSCGAHTQKFDDEQNLIAHWNRYQQNANLLPVCSNKIHALRVMKE